MLTNVTKNIPILPNFNNVATTTNYANALEDDFLEIAEMTKEEKAELIDMWKSLFSNF